MRSARESGESTSRQMADILGRGHLLVWFAAGHALLGGADVYLVVLELADLLHDSGDDPGAVADSGPLEAQGEDEEDVGDGTVHEGVGKGRCSVLPGDGGKDGGDDGTVQTEVQELLGTIGNTEDVVALARRDVKAGDGGDEEETGDNGELTPDHESWEVTPVSVEEYVVSLLAKDTLRAFFPRELCRAEVGDLHCLERANDGHKEEE